MSDRDMTERGQHVLDAAIDFLYTAIEDKHLYHVNVKVFVEVETHQHQHTIAEKIKIIDDYSKLLANAIDDTSSDTSQICDILDQSDISLWAWVLAITSKYQLSIKVFTSPVISKRGERNTPSVMDHVVEKLHQLQPEDLFPLAAKICPYILATAAQMSYDDSDLKDNLAMYTREITDLSTFIDHFLGTGEKNLELLSSNSHLAKQPIKNAMSKVLLLLTPSESSVNKEVALKVLQYLRYQQSPFLDDMERRAEVKMWETICSDDVTGLTSEQLATIFDMADYNLNVKVLMFNRFKESQVTA